MNSQVKQVDAANLVCVALDIHLWGGRQALKREHLQQYDSQMANLPPSALASMGSIKICDPEEVRKFARIKNEAIRLLEDNGLPLVGAMAIPKDRLDAVTLELGKLKAKFDHCANDLFMRFDNEITAWRRKWQLENPGNATLLKRVPDAKQVYGKLSFAFHLYAVTAPVAGDESHHANGGYHGQLRGLKGELFKAAAAEAHDLLTKYLVTTDPSGATSNKDVITQKTLRPLKRVVAKLRSFSFVDPSAGPLADVIEWSLDQLPAEGKIDGKGLVSIWSLARLLANPDEAARIAQVSLANGAEAAWVAGTGAGAVAVDLVGVVAAPATVPLEFDDSNGTSPPAVQGGDLNFGLALEGSISIAAAAAAAPANMSSWL